MHFEDDVYRRELHLSSFLFGIVKNGVSEYLFQKRRGRKSRSSTHGIREVSNELGVPYHQTKVLMVVLDTLPQSVGISCLRDLKN